MKVDVQRRTNRQASPSDLHGDLSKCNVCNRKPTLTAPFDHGSTSGNREQFLILRQPYHCMGVDDDHFNCPAESSKNSSDSASEERGAMISPRISTFPGKRNASRGSSPSGKSNGTSFATGLPFFVTTTDSRFACTSSIT